MKDITKHDKSTIKTIFTVFGILLINEITRSVIKETTIRNSPHKLTRKLKISNLPQDSEEKEKYKIINSPAKNSAIPANLRSAFIFIILLYTEQARETLYSNWQGWAQDYENPKNGEDFSLFNNCGLAVRVRWEGFGFPLII
jgi:hypothetical protein